MNLAATWCNFQSQVFSYFFFVKKHPEKIPCIFFQKKSPYFSTPASKVLLETLFLCPDGFTFFLKIVTWKNFLYFAKITQATVQSQPQSFSLKKTFNIFTGKKPIKKKFLTFPKQFFPTFWDDYWSSYKGKKSLTHHDDCWLNRQIKIFLITSHDCWLSEK